jgi:hypothetical protein
MFITVTETFSGKRVWEQSFRYFRLLGTVNPVNVKMGRKKQATDTLSQVEAGAWIRAKAGEEDLDWLQIETGASEQVKYVITDGDAGYDRLFASLVQVATLANVAEVTAGLAEGTALAADANRRKIVFRAKATNTGNIALGATGLAVATSAIVLAPGDVWIETDAAPAAWFAIADLAAQKLEVLSASA